MLARADTLGKHFLGSLYRKNGFLRVIGSTKKRSVISGQSIPHLRRYDRFVTYFDKLAHSLYPVRDLFCPLRAPFTRFVTYFVTYFVTCFVT